VLASYAAGRAGRCGRAAPAHSGAPQSFDDAQLARDLSAAVAGAGAAPVRVLVERVTDIPRTTLGKAPLVRVATVASQEPVS